MKVKRRLSKFLTKVNKIFKNPNTTAPLQLKESVTAMKLQFCYSDKW